jgi:hypothetical protein
MKDPKIAPGLGSDLADSIEASLAHRAPEALAPPWASQYRTSSTATSRILRLRIDQKVARQFRRRAELDNLQVARRVKPMDGLNQDGMRDGIIHCGRVPRSDLRISVHTPGKFAESTPAGER